MSSWSHSEAVTLPILWEGKRLCAPGVAQAQESTDEEIMARLKAGDANVLGVLFDRYSRLVLDIALHILHDRGEAEEIVQEVFLFLYQKAKLFDASKGRAKSWIVAVTRYQSLDRRSYLDRRGFYAGTVAFLDDILASASDLEREVQARISRAQLEKAFQRLPEKQRRALELYYFEGLELREISEKLNEPLGNVRHHYYRGMEQLRRSAIVRKLNGEGRHAARSE